MAAKKAKSKVVRAWAVVNSYGSQFLTADQQAAIGYATDNNSKCVQYGWTPHYQVVPLTGTFTPLRGARSRR